MVTPETLTIVRELALELSRAVRLREEKALLEALRALSRPECMSLTPDEAAQRLGVSVPTVKRWIAQGALIGDMLGERWWVSAESVARLVRLREALVALDAEGNPTPEEVHALASRQRGEDQGATAAGA